MCEAIGVDLYNQCITGGVARTLSARDFKEPPAVLAGGVLHLGREDGTDVHPQGMRQHPCTERLQAAANGDL